MGYRDYRDRSDADVVPCVVPSDLESSASGLSVGRLTAWPTGAMDGRAVRRAILESAHDLVVVRSACDDVLLGAQLQCDELVCWQADTLMYFEISTATQSGAGPGSLEICDVGDRSDVDDMVRQAFADYRNHWAANPALARMSVTDAYADWATSSLTDRDRVVLRYSTQDGQAAGVCLVDDADERFEEILLAGVVPGQRRQGAYQSMLRQVIARAGSLGKDSVVISTQASNIAVMRAWARVGMLPTISLNTLHVMKRESFPFAT